MGPRVFYRSSKAPEAPHGGLPVSIPGEGGRRFSDGVGGRLERGANMQIIIPLINSDMVADAAWRAWLEGLAKFSDGSTFRRVFVPVALDTTAFNVPDPLRNLNFLRPSGLPLPPRDAEGGSTALELVSRSMLKQLTETLCRFMISGSAKQRPAAGDEADYRRLSASEIDDGATAKLKIFLSHAKADGTGPAQSIRDYIYSHTQLAAFYDENDIAFGSAFAQVLEGDLDAHETAAMIAVRSARYASRPWCRRELASFRRPRREADGPGGCERWRMCPALVVDSMAGREHSPGIPEFGNSLCLRWEDELADQEEQIVTTVLRDVMLSAFHSAVGANLDPSPGADAVVINWLPDPTSLLHIPQVRGSAQDIDVIHPGRGMSILELEIFSEFFPRITFHSFEDYLANDK